MVVTLTSACVILSTAGVSAFVPHGHSLLKNPYSHAGLRQQEQSAACRPMRMSLDDASESRGDFLKDSSAGLVAGAIAVATSTGASSPASAATVSAWEQIQLPVASVLYDIAFDPQHGDHGLVVGAQGTFLEVRLCWLGTVYLVRDEDVLGCFVGCCARRGSHCCSDTNMITSCMDGTFIMHQYGFKHRVRIISNFNTKRSLNSRAYCY